MGTGHRSALFQNLSVTCFNYYAANGFLLFSVCFEKIFVPLVLHYGEFLFTYYIAHGLTGETLSPSFPPQAKNCIYDELHNGSSYSFPKAETIENENCSSFISTLLAINDKDDASVRSVLQYYFSSSLFIIRFFRVFYLFWLIPIYFLISLVNLLELHPKLAGEMVQYFHSKTIKLSHANLIPDEDKRKGKKKKKSNSIMSEKIYEWLI